MHVCFEVIRSSKDGNSFIFSALSDYFLHRMACAAESFFFFEARFDSRDHSARLLRVYENKKDHHGVPSMVLINHAMDGVESKFILKLVDVLVVNIIKIKNRNNNYLRLFSGIE